MTTNLEAKFYALETQLSAQNTGIQNSLDAILEALGAPPPTATTTLANVVTALAAMQSAQLTQHNALMSLIGQINTNTDTIINNNSLNAQRLISAILSTACPCGTTTAPLLPLPLDVTPTTLVDEAKCRRIQFYLSLFGTWLFDIANYGSSGAAITGDVLFSLLTAAGTAAGMATTGAEAGAIFGIPGAVVGTVVGLIVGAVYFLGGSQLVNYANDFNDPTLRDNMVQAMYAATNADEGYTAFKTTLLATIGGAAGEVIYTLWWSAWSNDVYSGVPVVDDSAFDGSICAGDATCVEITSVHGTTSLGFSGQVISYAIPGATLVSSFFASGGIVTTTPDFYVAGDYAGWTMRLLSGDHVAVQYHETLGPSGDESWLSPTLSVPYTFPTTAAVVIYSPDGGVITIRLCPPGVDNPA